MPNTHRRRDATVELRRVGVGGVYWAKEWRIVRITVKMTMMIDDTTSETASGK